MTARELIRQSRFFKETEKWGDLDKIKPGIAAALIDFREWTTSPEARQAAPALTANGAPVVLHAGYATDGHNAGSTHYKGEAVDFHISGIAYSDAILLLETWIKISGFRGGLGIYPDWNRPGFHLDISQDPKPFRRWGFVDVNGRAMQVSYDTALSKVMDC